MKKSSILILIIICLVGCKKGSNETTITGEIKGLGTDTLYLYGMDELYDRIDTIYVENDKFSYTTSVDTITSAYLLLKNRIEYPVFLDKGNKIKIKGDTINLNFLTISGNIVHLTPISFQITYFLIKWLYQKKYKELEWERHEYWNVTFDYNWRLCRSFSTLYICISLPFTIIWKIYRRVAKGIPIMK